MEHQRQHNNHRNRNVFQAINLTYNQQVEASRQAREVRERTPAELPTRTKEKPTDAKYRRERELAGKNLPKVEEDLAAYNQALRLNSKVDYLELEAAGAEQEYVALLRRTDYYLFLL